MIIALILFFLSIWIMKSFVDLLEYRRVQKLHKKSGSSLNISYGLSIDATTGKSKTTEKLFCD